MTKVRPWIGLASRRLAGEPLATRRLYWTGFPDGIHNPDGAFDCLASPPLQPDYAEPGIAAVDGKPDRVLQPPKANPAAGSASLL